MGGRVVISAKMKKMLKKSLLQGLEYMVVQKGKRAAYVTTKIVSNPRVLEG